MLIIGTALLRVGGEELRLNLNPAKERRVKRAVGLSCELCGSTYPSDVLEIHLLPRGRGEPGPDLQREILVLCPGCHREIHEFRTPRADQKILVRSRAAGARRAIRAILGSALRPYTPPEVDLAAVYEGIRDLSSFVLNGAG